MVECGGKTDKYKAVRIEKYGGPEVLSLGDIELARPTGKEALVRIHAAGLNFIDIYRRRGTYPVELPYTPGLEAAGVVESVGDDVTDVKPGDRVAYTGEPGAYAEACLVDASRLIPVPAGMSFEDAASFPLQGMTAHYLIHEYKKPEPGMTVLIHAAAGGMGLLLCQWAARLGAEVIGTVSSDKKGELAMQAGCKHIVDYTREDFSEAARRITGDRGVDLIIDGVGKSTFPRDLEAIRIRGTIVIFGSASGRAEPISPNELQKKSVRLCGGSLFHHMSDRQELMRRAQDVLDGIEAGWLKLRNSHRFALEEASEAHKLLESRSSTGKIVLTT